MCPLYPALRHRHTWRHKYTHICRHTQNSCTETSGQPWAQAQDWVISSPLCTLQSTAQGATKQSLWLSYWLNCHSTNKTVSKWFPNRSDMKVVMAKTGIDWGAQQGEIARGLCNCLCGSTGLEPAPSQIHVQRGHSHSLGGPALQPPLGR